MRLVMIDNYDSFTFNLVQLLREFNIEVLVFRNDSVSLDGIAALAPDWICISPGPKDPCHAGISKSVIEHFGAGIPVLGVCLGMQAINEVFGGATIRAPVPMHGKTCLVTHSGESIFAGIPSPFRVARYHSLCIQIRSEKLEPLAVAPGNVVMGIRHQKMPIVGVQFHPESFLTSYGLELMGNFLGLSEKWSRSFRALSQEDRFPRADFTRSGGGAGNEAVSGLLSAVL